MSLCKNGSHGRVREMAGLRVLIVDDDIPTVDAIVNSIAWESIGIDAVEVAYSAAQARRVFADMAVDIVVSDIEMPQASGLDLLKWVRTEFGDSVAFLLLTCHEKFDYAASAIRLDAAEYLTKPFDAEIMELSLRRIISKVHEKRRLQQNSRYGEWHLQNQPAEEYGFWLSLYNGSADRSLEEISREIEARGLPVNPHLRYRPLVCKIAEYEARQDELGQELHLYLLESIHSRILLGKEENRRVIRRHFAQKGLWLLLAVEDDLSDHLRERCEDVISACAEASQAKVTICIGEPVPLNHLAETSETLQQLIEQNVAFYGHAFTSDQAMQATEREAQVMEIEALERLLLEQDKIALLNMVKAALASRTALKTLSERTLNLIQQEMLQAVYSHLLRAGVQVTRLFQDENYVRLADRACRSALDMLRWVNYLLEATFAHEEEARKSTTLVERIHAYVHEHYQEEMGRNMIAAKFHLAPEYLAKLYHKKTGKYLKDYVREYRLEQAKRLLTDETVLVSDVAASVGFDNFSYFSTIFKKHTGFTPQEYRKKATRK